MQRRRGFSLVELLITGAIIAVLCIVALPNFRDAQSRTRVAKVKDDLRQISVALEGYYSEWRIYPFDGANAPSYLGLGFWFLPRMLSTPVAYMPTVKMRDPYRKQRFDAASPQMWQLNDYRYICTESTWGSAYDGLQGTSPIASQYYPDILTEFGEYRLSSAGPDGTYGPTSWKGISDYPVVPGPPIPGGSVMIIPFDPTNGLVSTGDIIRSQRFPQGYGNIPEN